MIGRVFDFADKVPITTDGGRGKKEFNIQFFLLQPSDSRQLLLKEMFSL